MARISVSTSILALALVPGCATSIDGAVGTSAPPLEAASLIIDDFMTGPTRLSSDGGTVKETKTGTMVGGAREIVLGVTPHPFAQETSITVLKHDDAGHLIVSSGLHSSWGTYLVYGHGVAGATTPLDLNLSAYDTIRLDFGSNDLPTSGAIGLYEAGEYATANWYAEPSNNPFSVDIPCASFTTNSGNPPPLEHVDQIVVLLQSGSANAGNDLELARLSARIGS